MIVTDSAARFVERTLPEHDAIQAEMADRAAEEGFPIIGREAGAFLATVAAMRQATTVFEFGSGFGYSATWFFRGMPSGGEVVLTEIHEEELDLAAEYLETAGLRDRAHLEHGDARKSFERYEGPFDVVLIDHAKDDYRAAFELAAPRVPLGGVIVADNVMAGPVSHEDLLTAMDGGSAADEVTALLGYLEAAGGEPGWYTTVLPLGNGLAVSVRTNDSE